MLMFLQNEIQTGLFIDSLFVVVKVWKQSLHRVERASRRMWQESGKLCHYREKELRFGNFKVHD